MWLLLAFVAVPLIEIALFVTVGGWLTLWPTLGIVLLTGAAGVALVRHQGLSVLREVQEGLAGARDPLSPIAHGALILVAGLLLLMPGFFTDTLGFLLMVPAVRRRVIAALAARVVVVSPHRTPGAADIVEGEWTDVTEVRRRHGIPPDRHLR